MILGWRTGWPRTGGVHRWEGHKTTTRLTGACARRVGEEKRVCLTTSASNCWQYIGLPTISQHNLLFAVVVLSRTSSSLEQRLTILADVGMKYSQRNGGGWSTPRSVVQSFLACNKRQDQRLR